MLKINGFGEFEKFKGVNVISLVKNDDVWNNIHALLNSMTLLTDHYSVLPSASYHMTSNNFYSMEWLFKPLF